MSLPRDSAPIPTPVEVHTQNMASPMSWREIDQIPGLVPLHHVEIQPDQPASQSHLLDNKHIELRWKKQTGLDWHSYLVVSVARVYGETQILLEKPDRSRSWASLRDISLLKLHTCELNKMKGIK